MSTYHKVFQGLLALTAFGFLLNGVLFYFQNWPEAKTCLGIGLLLCGIIGVDVWWSKRMVK